MLYNLYDYIKDIIEFPGLRLIKYISFRSFSALLISLTIALFVGKRLINRLIKRQIGEEIRQLGIEGDSSKKGTPTMGGIIIIVSTLIPALLFGDLTNIYVQLLIITMIWLGFIGFLDDYIKVFKKDKEGLQGKFKIYGQVTLGIVVGISLYFSEQAVVRVPIKEIEEVQELRIEAEPHSVVSRRYVDIKSTKTTIPFVKNNEFDYAWLSPFKGKYREAFTWIIYIIAITFIVTAVSNGTNLTDGMDGLTTGVSAIVATAIAVLAYLSGNIIYSDYLNIMYIPNSGEIVIILSSFIGALIGFLWYNAYPAQVFMGDTGSLAIGGVIAVSAIMIRKELLIPLLCGIFFIESLSVIIQRLYFKYSKKRYGKGIRVFKMAPLHHHFQKEGVDAIIKRPKEPLPESKIVIRFWIIALFLAVLSIITLKIR